MLQLEQPKSRAAGSAAVTRAAANAPIAFSDNEVVMLRQMMGQGTDDAVHLANNLSELKVPEGLTRDALTRYRTVAVRALHPGAGKRVTPRMVQVQTARIRIVNEALKQVDQ